MADTRLIERWLPIAELGIESLRERTPMTPFPAPNRLHVWWARRPLVASRAAVLASLLPADADRGKFMHAIGIHGDPVATRRKIDLARRRGIRFEGQAYSYPRAFGHVLNRADLEWLDSEIGGPIAGKAVLDPTAGGGSIPFETSRLGAMAVANDLNPVSALVMRATAEWPARFGEALRREFESLAERFVQIRDERLAPCFPDEPAPNAVATNYIWARTVSCPYCEGVVPLSPNWRLAPDGTGVKLTPHLADGPGSEDRVCTFGIVKSAAEQSPGTVRRGTGVCPYPDCERVIGGDEIKEQAQSGRMGEQLFAVVYKQLTKVRTKTGKMRDKWVRGYRAPRPEDDNAFEIRARLDEKLPEWDAFDIVPSERIPDGNKTTEPQRYGMTRWRDLFSPRQLLCHGTSVEVFREMLSADYAEGDLTAVRRAAYGYLALTLDTLLDYNNRSSYWDTITGRGIRHIFNRHDFGFVWSYAEMAPLVTGSGYDWAIEKTAKCIAELVKLVGTGAAGGLLSAEGAARHAPPITITCQSGDQIADIADASIDAVVMDPPYYDNVMYAELSDFFYVWLKRTAGHVFPKLFRSYLTDKDNEAVANPARFAGEKGARALAGRDYRRRMASIFAECRRVLKPGGIMTVMFTHKATGAWDALATGLMEAGFAITASWPVSTESEGGLLIKNKAAAKSTVFLVCRPRGAPGADDRETVYWEDLAPRVAQAVQERMEDFHEAGLAGVDLYLASFGPALDEFSRHWPLERGTPRDKPKTLLEEKWDPYAATPEDALDAARREVSRWQLARLTRRAAETGLDPATAFFVLAWHAFRAPVFPYDEALRLAHAVGVDLDRDIAGRLAAKKSGDLRLWDSAVRAAKGQLGPADGARGMIDALHGAAYAARSRNAGAARDLVEEAGIARDPRFLAALEAVLEVLPVSPSFTGVALEGEQAAAADDFAALENLRRLAFSGEVAEPKQLELWRDE